MSGTIYETDEGYDEALDEGYEEGLDEGYEEARPPPRRMGPRPVPTTPQRTTGYKPRPGGGAGPYVTPAQLAAALAPFNTRINTHTTAIKTVDGRVRGVMAEQTRTTAALRKESTDRKKDVDGLRKDLDSTRQLSALIPLLFPPGTGGTLASLAPLAFLLPPDALTGGGGSSNSSGSTSSSSSNFLSGNGPIALLAVAAASGAFTKA